jgi:hypothetical protein
MSNCWSARDNVRYRSFVAGSFFPDMMLGNDYFRRPRNYGIKKVRSIAEKIMNKQTTLEQEVNNPLPSTNVDLEYYIIAKGQLIKPLVFQIGVKNEEDSGLPLKRVFEMGDFVVTLGALGDRGLAPNEQLIGYDAKKKLEKSFYDGLNAHNAKLRAL